MKIILSDKVYIPRKLYDILPPAFQKEIIALFTKVSINPERCPNFNSSIPCPLVVEKGRRACYKCPQAKKVIKLYRKTPTKFIFERGDVKLTNKILKRIKNCFYLLYGKKLKSVDRRTYFKLPVSMQFNIKYSKLEEPRKTDQIKTCKEWLKKRYGQIVAPPRFGKSAVVAILASKSKTRVAIIVHQKELLDQFYSTFMKFTDIKERGKISGHKLITINPSPQEVEKLSICLFTWQQFISKKQGKKRLKEIRDKFGLIVVDEAHRSSSSVYSTIISRFKAKYRCGVTATPKRRDELEFRHNLIIGPPTVYGGSEQLSCEYSFIHTDWIMPQYKKMNNMTWNYLWSRMATDKKRNQVIIDYAKKDLKKGHKIIIPVKRVKHAEYLASELEKTEYNVVCFVASVRNREQVTKDIRKGKYDCVVAIRQLVSLGFDAPPMSALYLAVPSFDSSNLYQEYSRIRTVYSGKKKPLIRFFIDDGGIGYAFKKKAEAEMKKRGFKEV